MLVKNCNAIYKELSTQQASDMIVDALELAMNEKVCKFLGSPTAG